MCLPLILHLGRPSIFGSFTVSLLPQWLLLFALWLVSKCKGTLENFSVTCLKHLPRNSFLSSHLPIFIFKFPLSVTSSLHRSSKFFSLCYCFVVISSETFLELALEEGRGGFCLSFCFRYMFHLSLGWRVVTYLECNHSL